MMRYRCWGEHAEDLTDKVKQAISELPDDDETIVYGLMKAVGDSPKGSPRKIMVTCGKGHENVFTIDD